MKVQRGVGTKERANPAELRDEEGRALALGGSGSSQGNDNTLLRSTSYPLNNKKTGRTRENERVHQDEESEDMIR
jgi:hypothetical protein